MLKLGFHFTVNSTTRNKAAVEEGVKNGEGKGGEDNSSPSPSPAAASCSPRNGTSVIQANFKGTTTISRKVTVQYFLHSSGRERRGTYNQDFTV